MILKIEGAKLSKYLQKQTIHFNEPQVFYDHYWKILLEPSSPMAWMGTQTSFYSNEPSIPGFDLWILKQYLSRI